MARKEDIEEANKEENKLKTKGMKMDNRHCTDTICCLVFVAFVVAMIGISGYAFSKGDVYKIFTPFDSDGNQCGMANQAMSNSSLAGVADNNRDFTEYKYKYFSGITKLVSGQITPEAYNAVCVKTCPDELENSYSTKTDCLLNNDHDDECPTAMFNTSILMKSYCVPTLGSGNGTD